MGVIPLRNSQGKKPIKIHNHIINLKRFNYKDNKAEDVTESAELSGAGYTGLTTKKPSFVFNAP